MIEDVSCPNAKVVREWRLKILKMATNLVKEPVSESTTPGSHDLQCVRIDARGRVMALRK